MISETGPTRAALPRVLLALAAGAAAFALWWRTMDGPRALAAVRQASAPLVAAAVALVLAGQLVRIARWAFLLRRVGDVSFGRTFRLLAAGEFVNTFLPVRVGEVGRVVALSGTGGFTAGSAAASVVVDRLWAVAVRLLVLPLVLLLPGRVPRAVALSAALFAAAAAAALASVLMHAKRPTFSTRFLRAALSPLPARLSERLARGATSFGDAAVAMNLSPGAIAALVALSAGGLALQAWAVGSFFAAVGAPLPPLVALVGVAFVDLLAVVPAPPAGLGTAEWYVTLVFSIGFGAPRAQAAAAALLLHAAWILIVLVAGAAAVRTVGEMVPRRSRGAAPRAGGPATPSRTPRA